MGNDDFFEIAGNLPEDLYEPPVDQMFEDYLISLSSFSSNGLSTGGSEPVVWLPGIFLCTAQLADGSRDPRQDPPELSRMTWAYSLSLIRRSSCEVLTICVQS